MLTVVRMHLPSDVPISGCDLVPYIQIRKPDQSLTQDDIPETKPVNGFYIRCRWYRVQNEKRQAFCSVHLTEAATIQCTGCVKVRIPTNRSYHCTPKCFIAHWQTHRDLHARAASAGARPIRLEDDEVFDARLGSTNGSTFPSKPSEVLVQSNGEVWYEVGANRVYTPSADDVGFSLRFECTPMSVATKAPASSPTVLVTSRVIPAPCPIPRRLIKVVPDVYRDEGRSLQKNFKIVTYNVLAEIYTNSEIYGYCPSWALSWPYRRQNILKEIIGYQADILCLQEVQSDHFEDYYFPEMEKVGYDCVYKKKSGELFNGSKDANDGCATFYKRDRFSLVKKYDVEFNKAAMSLVDAIPNHSRKDIISRVLKDNVALILVLEDKESQDIAENGSSKRQLLCIGNTHINSNQELKDVKLWQVSTLVKGLEKIAASADIPIIVAGDFNSVPGSAPHALVTTGRVDPNHPELATDPFGIHKPLSKLNHPLPLVSAYNSFARTSLGHQMDRQRSLLDPSTNEPCFTNCTRDFVGTLDYIFYTDDSLGVDGLLELLDEIDLRKDTGLPSPEWSSDHIALMAEFRYLARRR